MTKKMNRITLLVLFCFFQVAAGAKDHLQPTAHRDRVIGVDHYLIFPELTRYGDLCTHISRYSFTYQTRELDTNQLSKIINDDINGNTEWLIIATNGHGELSCEYGAQSMPGFCRIIVQERSQEVSVYLCATE